MNGTLEDVIVSSPVYWASLGSLEEKAVASVGSLIFVFNDLFKYRIEVLQMTFN